MKRAWLITIIFCLLLLGGGVAVLLLPQVVPFDQCSDAYKRYADVEGVEATFIKDYKVNDSIGVDVTLIEAKDTTVWNDLCVDFDIAPITKIPIEFRENLMASNSYSVRVIKDSVDSDFGDEYRKYVIIFSYSQMTMCIFHNVDNNQYTAIIEKETKEI